jgi:hypothetical protein
VLAIAVVSPMATMAGSRTLTIEAQDWWDGPVGKGFASSVGHPGRHTHLEVTVPAGPVKGVYEVTWSVMHHRNSAGRLLRVKWQDDSGTTRGKTEIVKKINKPLVAGRVETGTIRIDTRNEKDGWRLWRFYAFVEHANGNIQAARPVVPVYVDNRKGAKNVSGAEWIRPSGWYKEKSGPDWGYLRTLLWRQDLPSAPIKGKWSPKIKIDINGVSKSPKISGWSVHVDPAFHGKDPGLKVASGKGKFKGKVTVDTSKLSRGKHRLVIRAKQDSGKRHHEAVGVFPFVVG